MKSRLTLPSCFIAVAVAAASFAFAQDRKVDRKAEEQRIRELDRAWVAAVAKKDAAAVAELYAEDGRLMPPNAEAAVGRRAVEETWGQLFKLPGFSLTFEPHHIEVAEAGDMAYDVGTYSLSLTPGGGAGRVQDRGKYLVVWQKVGGDWKVKADMFNSNSAPPAQQQGR